MSHGQPIGIGVIGLGFMGSTHLAAYVAAGDLCRVVAVCDRHPERRRGEPSREGNLATAVGPSRLFDPAAVRGYEDPIALLEDDEVQAVSICTHTDSHVPLALRALERGKHVLVEKPVALSSREVEKVSATASASETHCVPAFCMRFWPGWSWLRDRVADGTYGPVRSACFKRLGTVPTWGTHFYADPARSGGALIDLHIHDADFVRWCFGDPVAVVSTGRLNHIVSSYFFASGPAPVTAEGAWIERPDFEFRMRYLVVFENATAEFDLGSDPPLTVTPEASPPISLPEAGGYELQIRHFLEAIHGSHPPRATMTDALAVTRLLEAERESLKAGEVVHL